MLRLYDTHVHVWAMDPQRYPWHPILARAHIPTYAFTAEQLIREMDLAGVERAVLVQPSTYGWDHRYLFEVLAGYPDRFRGVVLADPADPQIRERLAELGSFQGVRGVRFHLLDTEQEQVFSTACDLIRTAVLDAQLVVDFQASPGHLAPVEAMAKAAPRLRIVIDHLGLIPWSGPRSSGLVELLALADLPNVYVKLSGLEEVSGESYPFQTSSQLAKAVVGRFGPRRVMWGSNCPHSLAAGSYGDLAGIVDVCLPALSDGDRGLIRWETAAQLWDG